MSAPPPGWYADPNNPNRERWFDGSSWTSHQRGGPSEAPSNPRAPQSAPPPVAASAGPTGRWYFVVTILTGGLFAAIPFFHAASRLDRNDLRKKGAGVAVASIISAALISVAPVNAAGEPVGPLASVGGIIAVAVVVVACMLLIAPRRQVYLGEARVSKPVTDNERAVSAVKEVRQKRTVARRIASEDPATARELKIGRPDSSRSFDDGGLIDLNWAQPRQLQAVLDISPQQASALAAARENLGRFSSVEEAIAFSDIDEASANRVRELGIVFAP